MKEYRNLRALRRRRKKGDLIVYYFYDMRAYGKPDISLGTNLAAALVRWRELQGQYPRQPKKIRPEHPDHSYLSLPTWAKRLYNGAKGRAKERGLAFTITKLEFAEVVARDSKCAVTGLEYQFSKVLKRTPFSPSIDRRDSSRGYEPGNVRIVTLAANVGMSNWGESALQKIGLAAHERRSANSPAENAPHAAQMRNRSPPNTHES